MEMMDGFTLLFDELYRNPINSMERKQFFINMFRYEIDRLHSIGYVHMDAHQDNAMVNLNYPYLTTDTNSEFIGRVILIDFGHTKEDSDFTPDEIKLTENNIDYSGNIFDKEANFDNINQLRIEFNNKRNNEREINRILELHINEQIMPPSAFTLYQEQLYQEQLKYEEEKQLKQTNIKTPIKLYSAPRRGWLQRTASAITRIPSFFSRKQMPLYKIDPTSGPIIKTVGDNQPVVQYIGGRQTNKYARVNTHKKRRRQKVSAKHNSISRRSTRKKR
jgi:hypothetical protein